MILVSVTAEYGTLMRYETGGELVRLTHAMTAYSRVDFSPDIVRRFRTNPDDKFSIRPIGPPPWHPPGTPVMARAA